ncbi:Berardinelli-Seip congenital lipodystrophy 2 (seipin) [Gryganskiella cystojenkinii]|nr:Berardinelli-Seip congenital lipodystrophy 2 (seipin) [Gryganskiella cystojenkinii]
MTLFEARKYYSDWAPWLLEPYVQQVIQTLTSSALHRKIVKFFIGLVVLVLLIGVAVAAYLSFYWVYIPQRGHVGQVHLQYGPPTVPGVIGHGPSAEIDFSRGGRYGQFLRGDQAYDISVNLHVPTSETNVEIGNFMVVVTLLTSDGKTIMTSSRPSILTYQSTPLKLMRTAWKAVPLVLDWSKEDQVLKVPLIENYIEDSSNPVSRALVQISSPDLQVYKSSIHLDAHFHGLRFFMYYYKISTALVFIAVFIFWEIIFSIVTWQVLAGWFGSDAEALAIAHQIRPAPEGQQQYPGGRQGQLRSPTNYAAAAASATQGQLPSTSASSGPSPRQPQFQEDESGSPRRQRTPPLPLDVSDSEFDEEPTMSRSQVHKGFGDRHDDIDDQDEGDQEIQQLGPQGRRSPFRDEAIVPERPLTPSSSQRRSESTQQRRRPPPTHQSSVSTDDGASTSTSSRHVASSTSTAQDFSMTSSSVSQLPPPPPPPSVRSERSSDFQMSSQRGGRGQLRTEVESEYTEEDEEYLQGVDDDDDDDDDDDEEGEVTFGEEDFADASHLSRPLTSGSTSVRARRGPAPSSSEGDGGAGESSFATSTGRSTSRSGR